MNGGKRTILTGANLTRAILIKANLSGAILNRARFDSVDLRRTIFSNASMDRTIFVNVDLGVATGLETVQHRGPSTIDIKTINLSKSTVPESFLRAAGVSGLLLTHVLQQSAKYYKCFISHSSIDGDFARKLCEDLKSIGVDCWLDEQNLKSGEEFPTGIEKALRRNDRVLVVFSKNSIASDWVKKEVKAALKRGKQDGQAVLLPIRTDKAVLTIDKGWIAPIKNRFHIGDFSSWKRADGYQQALGQLLRDLEIAAEEDHSSPDDT